MNRLLSASEGHFIAGFIEGEGHFGISEANGGQSFRCLMSLPLRDDDADLLRWLARAHRRRDTRATSPPTRPRGPRSSGASTRSAGLHTLWSSCSTRFELRGRKRREFEAWAPASSSGARACRTGPSRSPATRELTGDPPVPAAARGATLRRPDSAEALRAIPARASCAPRDRLPWSAHAARSRSTCARTTVRCSRCSRAPSASATCGISVRIRPRSRRRTGTSRASTRWSRSHAGSSRELMRGRKAAELEIWLAAVAERVEPGLRSARPRWTDCSVPTSARPASTDRAARCRRGPQARERRAETAGDPPRLGRRRGRPAELHALCDRPATSVADPQHDHAAIRLVGRGAARCRSRRARGERRPRCARRAARAAPRNAPHVSRPSASACSPRSGTASTSTAASRPRCSSSAGGSSGRPRRPRRRPSTGSSRAAGRPCWRRSRRALRAYVNRPPLTSRAVRACVAAGPRRRGRRSPRACR